MSMGPPIPEIRLFQHLILKIPGKGHGRGQSSRSHPVVPNWSSHAWDTASYKVDLENLTSMSWVRNRLSVVACQLALAFLMFLRYGYLKIWLWRSKVNGMGEITVQGHTLAQHPFDALPFHFTSVDPIFADIWIFQNLTLNIQGQCHGRSQRTKLQSWPNTHSIHFPFASIGPTIHKIWLIGCLTAKNQSRNLLNLVSSGAYITPKVCTQVIRMDEWFLLYRGDKVDLHRSGRSVTLIKSQEHGRQNQQLMLNKQILEARTFSIIVQKPGMEDIGLDY